MQGRVAGLNIIISGNDIQTIWRGASMSFYVDETRTDIKGIQGIPMMDIAYVKIMPPPFIGDFGNDIKITTPKVNVMAPKGGAILIYTKKGGDAVISKGSNGLDFQTVTGYSPNKYFGDFVENRNQLHSTIYWSPNIILDRYTNKFSIPLPKYLGAKGLRIIVEGIDINGNLIHEVTKVD